MAQDRFTRLIKIDKNGTKYYEELIPCPRCSVGNKADGIYYTGTCNGELIPSHVDNGVCFQCNGSGVYLQKTKEYTPEHEAELQKAREKRWEKARAEARAQAEKRNQAWLKKEGFDQDGNIWIILGDTYKNKEQLKALGCRFNGLLGWYSSIDLSDFPTAKFTAEELADVDCDGRFFWASYSDVVAKCDAKRDEYNQELIKKNPSEHVGKIGEKIQIRCKLSGIHTYTVKFNYHHITHWIFTFTDETGNVFVWNTTAFIDQDEGDEILLKGTIKAHGEFKGIKQTELQRCKIIK